MHRSLLFAVLVVASAVSAVADARVIRTAPGTVTGEMSYSAGQYWIQSGKEVLCVMVDPSDEAALAPLVDQHVSFTGPIQLWADKSRCIVVGPDFPKPAKKAAASGIVPVVIGAHGQPDLDACMSIGAIASPVAVRVAPNQGAGVAMHLAADHAVHLCGATADGVWESVVVPLRPGQDCGVTGAVDAPRPYAGPCKSGWVPASQVQVVAG